MNLSKKNLFTLLELMIVIAIIGILITLLLPSLRKARYVSTSAVCHSNQSQIYKGVLLLATKNDYKIPQETRRLATFSKTNPWDWFIADNLVEELEMPVDVLACPFVEPRLPSQIEDKTFLSYGSWFKDITRGMISSWAHVTPENVHEFTSEHLFTADMVNSVGTTYPFNNVKNPHTFNNTVVDIVSLYADGHTTTKKHDRTTNVFFSNHFGQHWRVKKQPNE